MLLLDKSTQTEAKVLFKRFILKSKYRYVKILSRKTREVQVAYTVIGTSVLMYRCPHSLPSNNLTGALILGRFSSFEGAVTGTSCIRAQTAYLNFYGFQSFSQFSASLVLSRPSYASKNHGTNI